MSPRSHVGSHVRIPASAPPAIAGRLGDAVGTTLVVEGDTRRPTVQCHDLDPSDAAQPGDQVVQPLSVPVDRGPRVLFGHHEDPHGVAPYPLVGRRTEDAAQARTRSDRVTVPFIRTDRQGRVAVVTLDDPQRRNALEPGPLRRAGGDDGRARVRRRTSVRSWSTGAAPAFCAGADLTQLGESRRDGLLAIYEGFLRVANSPLPTIAAVNGAAVGAGMNLALAADVRLAGRSARFDTRFLDLGIHPGGGHTWMLRRIVGPQAAMSMVVFGERLDGAEAERIGLVWRCVDDDDLLDAAVGMAARAADGPPELTRRIKATIRDVADIAEHADAVERELGDQLWSMDQPAFAERLAQLQARISGSR